MEANFHSGNIIVLHKVFMSTIIDIGNVCIEAFLGVNI